MQLCICMTQATYRVPNPKSDAAPVFNPAGTRVLLPNTEFVFRDRDHVPSAFRTCLLFQWHSASEFPIFDCSTYKSRGAKCSSNHVAPISPRARHASKSAGTKVATPSQAMLTK